VNFKQIASICLILFIRHVKIISYTLINSKLNSKRYQNIQKMSTQHCVINFQELISAFR